MDLALIVEDDNKLTQALTKLIWQQGLRPLTTERFNRACNLLEIKKFKLLLLDRVLPDGDGVDLIEPALAQHYSTKILVLTHRAQTKEVIKGLKLGADDYLRKPFSSKELSLRLKNLLSQQKIIKPDSLSYQNLILYPQTGQVIVNKKEYRLRPKQAELLACLIKHRGLTVTHQSLLNYIWGAGRDQPSKNTLSVYIRRLRASLGPAGSKIKTIRKIGYRLT